MQIKISSFKKSFGILICIPHSTHDRETVHLLPSPPPSPQKTDMNLEVTRGKSISRFVDACRNGNLKLAQRVLHSPNTINSDTLLSSACPLTRLTGLHAAAEFGHLTIIRWYMMMEPDLVDIRCSNPGVHATPLHYAARAGRHDLIAYLLKNEIKLASKHSKDANELEPVDWCLERRRDHCEYLFRDLASCPRDVDMLQPGRHRDMEMNSFEVDDIDEKTRQLRWWNRAIGTMVSSSPNKLHVAWKVPTNLGGLPLLGYNIYCRRLRTYIPPLDQTIEGREEERKRMAQLRKEIDDSSSANGTLGSGYQGKCEQTKHTVQPEELSVTVDQLWPACIYLVAITPFSMLGEGAASPWQEMQTGKKDGGLLLFSYTRLISVFKSMYFSLLWTILFSF